MFGLALPGCGLGGATATHVDYVHPPTARLHEAWELEGPELAPFTVEGVVVSPRIVPLSYEERAVKLLLASHTQATVSVESAEIGASRSLPNRPEVTLDRPARREGVWKAELTLGQLTEAELEALAQDGSLPLTVHLRVGDHPARLAFDIRTRNRTYLIGR